MCGFIGKGSGNGQEVRDEILNIMHRHHISESKGHFYEEWHQKLHNNTTPDDIPICEALLEFLKSGQSTVNADGSISESTGPDLSKYWNHLAKNGITRERLASYERNIIHEPEYKPETIGCFENYLRILKQMHSSDDLDLLFAEARPHLNGDI